MLVEKEGDVTGRRGKILKDQSGIMRQKGRRIKRLTVGEGGRKIKPFETSGNLLREPQVKALKTLRVSRTWVDLLHTVLGSQGMARPLGPHLKIKVRGQGEASVERGGGGET